MLTNLSRGCVLAIAVAGCLSCARTPVYKYSGPLVQIPPAVPYRGGPLANSGEMISADRADQADHFLRQHPNDPKALNDVGIIHATNGDLEGGTGLLDKAHQMAPDDPTITYNDARLKFQQGRTQESIVMIEDVLREHPDMSEARTALAAMQVDHKDYEKAAATIKGLPQDQAKTMHALLVIGAIQLFMRQVDEGIQSFQEAVKLDPNNAVAQFDLGCAYLAQNQMSRAEANFRGALAKDPRLAEAHNNLGALYTRAGNHAAATVEYRQASRLSPNNSVFANNLTNVVTGQRSISNPKGENAGLRSSPPDGSDVYGDQNHRASEIRSTSVQTDTIDAEAARQAIDRIRRGPHEAIPLAETRPSSGNSTSVTIENGTSYQIRVYLAGPVGRILLVPPGSTRSITVVPGEYSLGADVSDSSIIPSYGVQKYSAGVQYAERFVVGTVR